LVLEVEYLDRGYGVIQAERMVAPEFKGTYRPSSRAVCYTRLDTGTVRTALFAFDSAPEGDGPGDKPDLLLRGLDGLVAVRVVAMPDEERWRSLQVAIPNVNTPAVSIRREMDVVCDAGVPSHGTLDDLPNALNRLREMVPLAKALGFNGIECYVRWDFVEPNEQGVFDWSFYDAIVDVVREHDLKIFPLLIVGSAYALPDWFFKSNENVGFVCLEHGLENPVQSIWSPHHQKHVTRFLQAFGAHYEPMNCLLGVRLGPSGNYGESQYPAGGNWGYKGVEQHIHIGLWAGDAYARDAYRSWLSERYASIDALNEAWRASHPSFATVEPVLPDQCLTKRQRLDLMNWYNDAMSDWCEWWAIEARKAMPNTVIHQSSGGWGSAEIGTDYSAQTKSMLKIDGGIRLTNELDSFHQCYYATRLGATAARLYERPLGFEPAMGHTARGVAGRLFNCITNNGAHFFTYYDNIFSRQSAVDKWLELAPLLDATQPPQVEVALYYPQTQNLLSSDTFRYLNAWGFNPYARVVRDRIEVDYLDDRLIADGFLDRYKVLVFVWGDTLEAPVLAEVDRWLRAGGTIIFSCQLRSHLETVEGDETVFERWAQGDVGKGTFFRYVGDDEPPERYADYVHEQLLEVPSLSAPTQQCLRMNLPNQVFVSLQADGGKLFLNFRDESVTLDDMSIEMEPFSIMRVKGG
jgi:hypothetical protein